MITLKCASARKDSVNVQLFFLVLCDYFYDIMTCEIIFCNVTSHLFEKYS